MPITLFLGLLWIGAAYAMNDTKSGNMFKNYMIFIILIISIMLVVDLHMTWRFMRNMRERYNKAPPQYNGNQMNWFIFYNLFAGSFIILTLIIVASIVLLQIAPDYAKRMDIKEEALGLMMHEMY